MNGRQRVLFYSLVVVWAGGMRFAFALANLRTTAYATVDSGAYTFGFLAVLIVAAASSWFILRYSGCC